MCGHQQSVRTGRCKREERQEPAFWQDFGAVDHPNFGARQVAGGHHVEIFGRGDDVHRPDGHVAGEGDGGEGFGFKAQSVACQGEAGAGEDGQVALDPRKKRERAIFADGGHREAEEEGAVLFDAVEFGCGAASVGPGLAAVVGGGQVDHSAAWLPIRCAGSLGASSSKSKLSRRRARLPAFSEETLMSSMSFAAWPKWRSRLSTRVPRRSTSA